MAHRFEWGKSQEEGSFPNATCIKGFSNMVWPMIETSYHLLTGCYYLFKQEQRDLSYRDGSYYQGHGFTHVIVCMVPSYLGIIVSWSSFFC